MMTHRLNLVNLDIDFGQGNQWLANFVDPSSMLVIEMGGSTIRAATKKSGSLVIRTFATDRIARAIEPAVAIGDAWQTLSHELDHRAPRSVVLAMPGPVFNGIVDRMPTLLGTNKKNFPALDVAARNWPNAAIWLTNDLTSAGYCFLAQGARDFCVVTLGSGIGAKLFLNGTPLLGAQGSGGEIGHWHVPGMVELPCDCGENGHLGAVASGRGTLAWVKYSARRQHSAFCQSALGTDAEGSVDAVTTYMIAKHFACGCDWTHAAMSGPASALGHAFALIHLSTGIEEFFLVGGFAEAMGPKFAGLIGQKAAKAGWPTGIDWTTAIQLAADAQIAGVVGAFTFASMNPPDLKPSCQP